jgi:pilus assembly protein CpaF
MIRQSVFEASVGYFLAPIGLFLDDDSVTEVMVNRFDQIYVERDGRIIKTNAVFESEDALLSAVHNVAQWVGRKINEEHPILDARLPDGSRVHAILPPGSRGGTCLTIRKFTQGGLSLDDLLRFGSISESAREFLEICVRLHKNIIVSGGTGTGKTSLLGAMSAAVPPNERVIVIEDTSELKLRQEHVIYLEVQRPDPYGRGELTIRQLFVASLRMRPDRIIVGEVRGGEALDMVQSMLSGHSGSLSTVHANSARDAVVRLETLSLMSDVQIPIYVARAQVASAIDLVVQLERFSADGSRKISRITEVVGLTSDQQYELRDLFSLQLRGKDELGKLITALEPTGVLPTFAQLPYEHGLEDQVRHSSKLWEVPRRVASGAS